MNWQFLTIWDLTPEERNPLYAAWLSWAVDLLRSEGAMEREQFGEPCLIANLGEAVRVCACAEGAPNLNGKVDLPRLFWELVRIGVVFPDRITLPGHGRMLFTAFRLNAIEAFCRENGETT